MVDVDDGCLSIPSGDTLRRAACDTTSDAQTWKIESNNDGWYIKSKSAAVGTAYSRCIDGDDALHPDAVLANQTVHVKTCVSDWHDLTVDQTFTIEQRSTDNMYVLFAYPGVGIQDLGQNNAVV